MSFTESLKKLLNIESDDANRVMIVGGLGYAGSHVTVELLEMGYNVCIVDNLSNTNIDVLDGIEKITQVKPVYENIDCTDFVAMDKFMNKYPGIRAVLMFTSSHRTQTATARYRNDIMSLVTLLELMPLHKVQNLLIAGAENNFIAERIIEDVISENSELRVKMVEFGELIGAHGMGLIGEVPGSSGCSFVQMVAEVAAGFQKKVRITDDIERDYMYVVDFARLFANETKKMIEESQNPIEKLKYESGCKMTQKEVMDMFGNVNNVKTQYFCESHDENPQTRDEEVQSLVVRTDTNIDNALLTAWKWQLHLSDNTNEDNHKRRVLGGS